MGMQMAGCIHFKLNRTAVTGAFMGFEFGHVLYPAIYSALYSSLADYKYCFAKVGVLFWAGGKASDQYQNRERWFFGCQNVGDPNR